MGRRMTHQLDYVAAAAGISVQCAEMCYTYAGGEAATSWLPPYLSLLYASKSLACHLKKLEFEHELEPFPCCHVFLLKEYMSFITSLIKM